MSAGWDSDSLEHQVSSAAHAQQQAGLGPPAPDQWELFGKAVLLLCDSPFAEWNLSPVPGLTQAGVQVRLLADRYGVKH